MGHKTTRVIQYAMAQRTENMWERRVVAVREVNDHKHLRTADRHQAQWRGAGENICCGLVGERQIGFVRAGYWAGWCGMGGHTDRVRMIERAKWTGMCRARIRERSGRSLWAGAAGEEKIARRRGATQ